MVIKDYYYLAIIKVCNSYGIIPVQELMIQNPATVCCNKTVTAMISVSDLMNKNLLQPVGMEVCNSYGIIPVPGLMVQKLLHQCSCIKHCNSDNIIHVSYLYQPKITKTRKSLPASYARALGLFVGAEVEAREGSLLSSAPLRARQHL